MDKGKRFWIPKHMTGYEVVGDFVRRFWENKGYGTVIVALATSHDGERYVRHKTIATPINNCEDIEFLDDWWEGEQAIDLEGIVAIDDVEVSGGIFEESKELLLINENKSNNFDVKSNKSQCIDCIHNDICQFYKALCANVICYPCGFYEAKSNEELFKQALVEGVSRHFDKIIEQEKQIEEMEAKAVQALDLSEMIQECCPSYPLACRYCMADEDCGTIEIVTHLYNAGYRKQIEGENIAMYPSSAFECSICNWQDWALLTADSGYNFCPNCGAKMTRKEDEGK